MSNYSTRPRILFVTPEVAFVPERAGNCAYFMGACSGSFGDFPAQLINSLINLGADVHVAQPDYRRLFEMVSQYDPVKPSIRLPIDRVHLAEDRAIFYSKPINSNSELENIKISLAFQREVINQIAPRVQPDLIHCHDWMTGLIPAAAKEYGMACLFTVQNAESAKSLLFDFLSKSMEHQPARTIQRADPRPGYGTHVSHSFCMNFEIKMSYNRDLPFLDHAIYTERCIK